MTNYAPEVTIVLPLYNCGPDLEQCFARLDATDLCGGEVLLVDDGSTDGTAGLARDFAATRPQVRLITLPQNRGVAAARNEALRAARGEFVWFVDWDDAWDPSIVATMLARARATAADVVVCRATWGVRSDGGDRTLDGLADAQVFDGQAALDLILQGRLRGYLWNKLLRREALPAEMFPPMKSQSDFCGLVPVLVRAERVATVGDVLYTHLERAGSITNSGDPDLDTFYTCRRVVEELAAGAPQTPALIAWRRHYEHRFLHLAVANTALRLGRTRSYTDGHVRRAAAAIRVADVARVATVAPSVAVRALALKVTGPRYATVYRGYVSARARLRSGRQVEAAAW